MRSSVATPSNVENSLRLLQGLTAEVEPDDDDVVGDLSSAAAETKAEGKAKADATEVEEDRCTVCLGDFEKTDLDDPNTHHAHLMCGHKFHMRCLKNMMEKMDSCNSQCPNCRAHIIKKLDSFVLVQDKLTTWTDGTMAMIIEADEEG